MDPPPIGVRVILFESLIIKLSSTPHHDLPSDARLFAQLLVDGEVVEETEPVDSEPSQSSWKLKWGIKVPPSSPCFVIAIICESASQGTRLLGSVELTSKEILTQSEEGKSQITCALVKVDDSGPCLELASGFLVETPASQQIPVASRISAGGNAENTGLLDGGIISLLHQMMTLSESNSLIDSVDHDVIYGQLLLHPEKDEKSTYLNTFGDICTKQYCATQNIDHLNWAITVYEDAVQLTSNGHLNKPTYLFNLGNSYLIRFELLASVSGELHDIEKSILMFEDAIRLTPDGHPNKVIYLYQLVNLFSRHFKHVGEGADINKLFSMFENAVQLTPDNHPDKPDYLYDLGSAFLANFETDEDLVGLDKSISILEHAVQLTPDSHPDKLGRLSSLGNSFWRRFNHHGELMDLNKSISLLEGALQLTSDGQPSKHGILFHLSMSLFSRFEQLGDLIDIDKSIIMLENAIKSLPDGHPDKPGYLNNLGNSFLSRFDHLHELVDINKSISMLEDAVQLAPDGDSDKHACLSNLGNAFLRRFTHLDKLIDLNKSISMLENALQLTPDSHSGKPGYLSNLGISISARFQRLGDPIDMEKSISMKEDAVQLTHNGHPEKPARLSNLGSSFFTRFKHLGSLIDLEKSISTLKDAVQLTPDGHPSKPHQMCSLGESFYSYFQYFNDFSVLDQAIVHFSSAACSPIGAPSVRFWACTKWTQCAQLSQHSSLLNAYKVALELLPQLAWIGLPVHDRHHELITAGEVVIEAAAAAIELGEHDTAIEWLEQGRSVVWGQILQLRTPFNELQEKHPELAAQIMQVSNKLEQASSRDDLLVVDEHNQQSPEQIAQWHHQLALDWEEHIKKVRELPGFERFILPKKLSELTPAARFGPIVILNICKFRCDALILMPNKDSVHHLPLSTFTLEQAQELQGSLQSLLLHNGPARFTDRQFEYILSELWSHIVRPVLDTLGFMRSSSHELPRIWWCPTGPLAFLPIHAAGLYGATAIPGSQLSEFAISSYTPTVSALIDSAQHSTPQKFQLLAVAQPNAQGQSHLPSTQDELAQIRERAGDFKVLSLVGSDATVERVVSGMKESSWVHFACHGVQKMANPNESGLLLAGSECLKLSDIIKMSLPSHAGLAFLSACQTATGTETLSEEAVHLAAGMLLAGYSGVIATMWKIIDKNGPHVADDVYAHLFKETQPDHTQAAHALHYAIQQLCRSTGGKSYIFWVPFIHIGA